MLIYDHNKDFLGIDGDDLKHLGFASAESLFEQCSDLADLFVKRPGYIHNFKNFEWIDFVLHAEAEDSKAIIHTAKQNFTCKLVIKPFYLNSAPSQSGYMVVLQNLEPLSAEEDAKVAQDIEMHPMPTPSAPITESIPSKNIPLPDVSLPNFDDMPATELHEPDIFDVPDEVDAFAMPKADESADEAPFKLDLIDDETPSPFKEEVKEEAEPAPKESEFDPFNVDKEIDTTVPSATSRSNLPDIPMLGDSLSKQDHEYIDTLTTDKDYVYNPEVAADELGLPVDLIEEFIGDFIQQSHDFHDELFEKVAAHDRDSVQTLSHKLKGVAANLRIEDAFEVLTIINTSHDFEEIMANLKYYYHLVAKLEGDEEYLALENENAMPEASEEATPEATDDFKKESPPVSQEPEEASEKSEDNDIYDFDQAKKESEPFEIPDKAPVFKDEDHDDDIYNFDAVSESSAKESDAAEQERVQEKEDDELFELKKRDDEPLLIVEPEEAKTPQPLPEREFLDVVDTDETFKFDELAEKFKDLETTSHTEKIDDGLVTPAVEVKSETVAEETLQESLPETAKVVEKDLLSYDLTSASHELGLKESLVKELVQDFKTDSLLHIDEISTAIASFDAPTWQRLAHDFIGISDNLRLIEISNELQILIRTNDAQKAKMALDKYRNYVNQL